MRNIVIILLAITSLQAAAGKSMVLPKKFDSHALLKMNFKKDLKPLYIYTAGTSYYMATNGSDSNNGLSTSTPFLTIEHAVTFLTPGDTLFIRGGTYNSTKSNSVVNRFYIQNVNGNSSDSVYIKNYPGETVVFDMASPTNVWGSAGDGVVGLKIQDCSWLYVKGIRITNILQPTNGMNTPAGMIIYDSDHIFAEQIEIDNIQGYGMYIQGTQNPGGDGSQNVYIKNCDVHHIGDLFSTNAWEGANGFNITGGDLSDSITFDGCRGWWCSDDAFDNYSVDAYVVYKNCWAFWNGYQPGTFTTGGDGMGFKLGPLNTDQSANLKRVLHNCLSFENRRFNFDQNSGGITCKFQVYNCTSYDGRDGQSFFFGANTSIAQTFKNNIAVSPGTVNGTEIQSGANVSNNSWNGGVTANTSDFISISSVGMDGPRGLDGSLPVTNFLRLAAGSDLIDAGTNVGLPFSGASPDLGAFESGGNIPPTANAGSDQSITLPTSQVTLSGSGNDPDGSITAYAWSKTSGPATYTIVSPTSATTDITGLVTGIYVFRLTVTDNDSDTGYDEVTITVNAAPVAPKRWKGIKLKK